MPILQKELTEFMQEYNAYGIRKQKDRLCPPGVPEDNFLNDKVTSVTLLTGLILHGGLTLRIMYLTTLFVRTNNSVTLRNSFIFRQ